MGASAKKPVSKRRGHLGKGRTETRIAGKFRSTYTDARLYDVVRKAALYCKPSYPKELRQTQFDDCRFEIGHADAPTARQIAKRLGRSWPDIVSDAVDETANLAQKTAVKNSDDAPWLTVDHLFYALRRAARHLGQKTLTRDQYEVARTELIAEDRKRHRFGGLLDENLPTVAQIERIARSVTASATLNAWELALSLAQLVPNPELLGDDGKPPLSDGSDESAPVKKAKGGRRGVDLAIASHYFVEASGGLLPGNRAMLEDFAKLAGVALSRQTPGKKFTTYLKEANEYRESLGLVPAEELADTKAKIDFDLSKLELAGVAAPVVKMTFEDKLAKVAEFLDYCDEFKKPPRQHLYKGLAPKRRWPSQNNLDAEGLKWDAWLKAADEWRAKQAKNEAA